MSTNVTLANRLVEIRKKRNLTQTELVKSINDKSGKSYDVISRISLGNYESGKRHPDSRVIKFLCQKLNVSADYLLGLTDTENQAFAEIAETTGLDENSIKYLSNTSFEYRNLINQILSEEPMEYDDGTPPQYPEEDCFDVEKAYQEHLRQQAWEKKINETPILEHLSNDWSYADYQNNLTDEEIEEQLKKEHEEFLQRESQFDDFPVPTYEDCLEQEKRFEAYWAHEAAEKNKSNLLSAILEYINYQSGCRLETMNRSEELSEEHSLYIGIGKGKSVQFPSKESDELFEFMLIQKVIDALKKFKANVNK